MDFLISYRASDIDGRSSEVLFPVTGESASVVLAIFKARVREAAEAGWPTFSFGGKNHHVRNFVSSIPRAQQEFLTEIRYNRGLAGVEYFSTSKDAEGHVTIFGDLPKVMTLQDWLQRSRLHRRSRRWVGPLADAVFLADELWNRDILLPARRTADGMWVTPKEGESVLLKPEMEYWVEGYQDDLIVTAGSYVLEVFEAESGDYELGVVRS